MSRSGPIAVQGRDGLRGTIEAGRDDAGRVAIRLEDGRVVDVPAELVVEQHDGTYRLALGLADLGLAEAPVATAEGTAGVIPVVREELEVGKRRVETGTVRIRKVVHEHEEVVDIPLLREQVEVVRVPINRIVEGPVEARQEGETWILPLLEEVLVVEKRLMLKEEVRITRTQVEEHRPQRVTLRSEAAEVDRVENRGNSAEK